MMNRFGLIICCLAALTSAANAQNIAAQISSQEAFVGQPIVLQVLVVNARTHTPPKLPKIDGLEIQSAGAPQESRQTSIINGRRSQRVVLMYVFQITPRAAGTFTIPSIEIEVDGKPQATQEFRFVATKSETGDLMFVEVSAADERVFVGQPIKFELKIWIRPYRDRERNLKLSEAHMWQLIDSNTDWGVFQERLDELAAENRRPIGEEVLRDDGNGTPRGYYLYEIEATIYPQKPGPIEVDGVQVVSNYPTALGQARSRISSIFGDDDFLGGSMFDDFFRDSPFNQSTLAIKSARPISESAQLPPVEVVEVPTQGRPDDYRGAVGNYRIGTRAEPLTVNAGDPITLNIVLQGDGPMELVEAPPIASLTNVTENFKVADDSLAGFVQDDAKLFNTTLRPRRAGISEIPPIPFSFFNPKTEMYETTYSKAIPITVHQAESLSFDAIVGNSTTSRKQLAQNENSVDGTTRHRGDPFFTSYSAEAVLASEQPAASLPWFAFALPPAVFGICFLTRHRAALSVLIRSSRNPYSKAIAGIRGAQMPAEIISAIGAFRSDRLNAVLAKCNEAAYSPGKSESLEELKSAALDAMRELGGQNKRLIALRVPAHSATAILLLAMFGMTNEKGWATQQLSFTKEQQQTLLMEAQAAYDQALHPDRDPADSKQLFDEAIRKYELVADSQLRSSKLYFNLGNAYLGVANTGKAIACFEQAHRFAPRDPMAQTNLDYARKQLPSIDDGSTASNLRTIREGITTINALIPRQTAWFVAFFAWTLIWVLPAMRLFSHRLNLVQPIVALCLLLFLLSAGSFCISLAEHSSFDAVAVGESVELYEGDSDRLPVAGRVEQGERVKVLDERGTWVKVKRLARQQAGWLPREQLFILRL